MSTTRKSLKWVLNVGNYPGREKVKGIRQKEHLESKNKHKMFQRIAKEIFFF